jgi:hypothetical protein
MRSAKGRIVASSDDLAPAHVNHRHAAETRGAWIEGRGNVSAIRRLHSKIASRARIGLLGEADGLDEREPCVVFGEIERSLAVAGWL